jgi:hypothetical protein
MAYKIKQTKKLKEIPYQISEQKRIEKINEELEEQQVSITILTKNTLLVKADGKNHQITRQDLRNYMRYEAGSMSGFRRLGTIQGDWRPINNIAEDVTYVFNKIDRNI